MSQAVPPPITSPYAMHGMEPTRTSVAAVISLICGILGCFIITGIVAIITGIIGLKATKNPQVKGRGLAIAGLILGVITTLAGTVFAVSIGGVGYFAYKQYAPAVQSVTALAEAAATGDVDKAMPYVDTTKISRDDLEAIVDQLKPLGKPTGFKPTNPNIQSNNGVTTVDLDGVIEYPNSVTKSISVRLLKQTDGTFKATKLSVE